jgi:rRNA biogenesis protein RRP5
MVLVIKKDPEGKKIGFSMKASHFEDDKDSDDDSLIYENDSKVDSDKVMADALISDKVNDTGEELDSDDGQLASKLTAKMKASKVDSDVESSDPNQNDDGEKASESEEESSDDESDDDKDTEKLTMDTDVGFD